MPVNFIEKLKELALTQFTFASFTKEVSSVKEDEKERNVYLIFELSEPISKVVGSMSEYDPNGNRRVNRHAFDVMNIKCNLDIIDKYQAEFTFDQDADGNLTMSGSYKGDLFLDVSRQDDVWLTDTKFAKMSSDMKKQNRSEKIRELFAKIDQK